MRVVWTRRALATLREIHDYIAADDPSAARDLARRLLLAPERLCRFPHSCPRMPELDRDDVRQLNAPRDPYRIIYWILAERIDIVAVSHHSQMLPESLNAALRDLVAGS